MMTHRDVGLLPSKKPGFPAQNSANSAAFAAAFSNHSEFSKEKKWQKGKKEKVLLNSAQGLETFLRTGS